MAGHITIAPEQGSYRILAGKHEIGRTDRALRLTEGSYPAVLYIPQEDVDPAYLELAPRHTTCPHKGEASYYSITTPEGRLENAVWSYRTPKDDVQAIAGHLAFYPDKVRVEPVG